MRFKQITTTIAVAALLGTGFLAPNISNAANANFAEQKVRELNSDGRRACRSLAGLGYKATIVGIIEASSRSGFANFRVKSCFPSASQCETFIRNINREISGIDLIRKRSCSPL